MIGPKVTMELRRKTETDDEMGGKTITWAGLRNIEGVLTTIRGNERLSADKLTVIADYYFYIDYPIGIKITDGTEMTEKDIFQYSTRKFKIIYINNLGASQNLRLKITLKEEV